MQAAFKNKKVLITGGLGFIGSNLARRLVRMGARVTIVDSLIPEYGGSLFNIREIADRVNLNISDVRDPHGLAYLVKDQQYLFNLAGQTSHLDSMRTPFVDLEINSRAQLSILEACRQVNPEIKIVFASTRQVYGKPCYLPVDEKHPLQPVDVNGINKLSGEWYHLVYNDVYGIRSSVLRLTNTIGPCMRIKDARQTFLGIWIRLLLEDKSFEVWGGDQLRDFTYVDDCTAALLMAAHNEAAVGRVINLGGSETISLRALADLLVQQYGRGRYTVRAYPDERLKIDIGDYYSDFSLARSLLGWEPREPLTRALAKTLAYFQEHLEVYL